MFELKFELLRCVCDHEHFIPLNLPLDIRKKGGVHESTLNDHYCKRHFLVGLLLREVNRRFLNFISNPILMTFHKVKLSNLHKIGKCGMKSGKNREKPELSQSHLF